MKRGFRKTMAGVHIWSGLVLGWLLFAIFLTGTLSYFRPEITRWMQPGHRPVGYYSYPERHAVAKLQRTAPSADRWFINFPDERHPLMTAAWLNLEGTPRFETYILDPATGDELMARETYGGEFFYRFHFELLIRPWGGRWIVGVAAMIMLVAILTGVIIHRRIFRDFFTFRPYKRDQRTWLDAHNFLGVLALPFHLMITYTGLITLMAMYMPWGINAAYDGDVSRFFAEVGSTSNTSAAAGTPAPLASLSGMIEKARSRLPGGRVGRITVDHPGDANATVVVMGYEGSGLSKVENQVVFHGVSGEVAGVSSPEGPAISTYGIMYGLHLARFAGSSLRWLFFISGAMGTAMIATGLVLWTVKRRSKRSTSPLGLRLVDILNIGVIVGLPIGIAGYFWANRLLPVDMTGRANNEILCLFALWLAAALYAAVRPARRAWIEEMIVAALLFLLLPVLNALTTNTHLLNTLLRGDWAMAGVDLTVFGCGLVFAVIAGTVARRAPARTVPEPAPAAPGWGG